MQRVCPPPHYQSSGVPARHFIMNMINSCMEASFPVKYSPFGYETLLVAFHFGKFVVGKITANDF